MSSMTDFHGQGIPESWSFSILGLTHFCSGLCVLPPVKSEREVYICSQNSLTWRWLGKS